MSGASNGEGMAHDRRGLWLILGGVLLTGALVLLYRELHDLDWRRAAGAAGQSPWWRLAVAVVLTGVAGVVFGLYDLLACRGLRIGVSAGRAMLTGAAAFSISNLVGVSYLSAGAIRMRLYRDAGVPAPDVLRIVVLISGGFFLGLAMLAGAMLLTRPGNFTGTLAGPVPALAGAALLACGLALLWWLGPRGRLVNAFGTAISLPGRGAVLPLTGLAIVDLALSGVVLFVLVPDGAGLGLHGFLMLYLAATVLGILSAAPGGIGVFEAAMLVGLNAAGQGAQLPEVVSGLALFRAVYYLLPFAVTVIAFGALSLRRGSGLLSRVQAVIAPLVPALVAGTVLAVGSVMLISGAIPPGHGRMAQLRQALPLPVVGISHLAGSVIGLLLIVLARGLFLRRRRALILVAALLAAGGVAAFLHGMRPAPLLICALVLGLLWLFCDSFYRDAPDERIGMRDLLPALAVGAISVWVGLVMFSQVPYANDLWWRFDWDQGGAAARFVRASFAVAVVILALALNGFLRGQARLPAQPIPDQGRRIIRDSEESEANIALMGDKRFLLSDDGAAFLTYADAGPFLVSKGDPFGQGDHEQLLWRFRELADGLGKQAVFYAIGTRHLAAYLDMGLTLLKIGEVARIDLAGFSLDGPRHKPLRYAVSRAARDGFVFDVIPAAGFDAALPELRRVSDAWLRLKHGSEKGFALGAFDPAYLRNFDTAVMRRGTGGQIVAFANILRGRQGGTVSPDLMRHLPDTPLTDALFCNMMLWARDQGYRCFDLGAAPLAAAAPHPLSSNWSRISHFIYTHGEALYGFEGLRGFKQKFDPDWRPHYMACPGGSASLGALWAVNRLISGGVRGLV